MQNSPSTSKVNENQAMPSAIVVAPSPGSANTTPTKPFDDSCFKTPLPPTNRMYHKKGRPPKKGPNMGNRQQNGHHKGDETPKPGRGKGRGRGASHVVKQAETVKKGGRQRIVPQKPLPPPKKHSLHDMWCPKTRQYLKKFKVPKYASLAPEKRTAMGQTADEAIKTEIKEEEPCCSKTLKTEVDEEHQTTENNTPVAAIKVETVKESPVKTGSTESNKENKEEGKEKKKIGKKKKKLKLEEGKKEKKSKTKKPKTKDKEQKGEKKTIKKKKKVKKELKEKKLLPFVDELIIDEFSLLCFTCREDERTFAIEAGRRRALFEQRRRRFIQNRVRKINRIKRKIRRKKKLIEYHNRALRKKSREIKRNKARRIRREKHAQLKRTVREAKANGTLTKELKKAWLDEKERVLQRNEEIRKRKREHETRKETRRVKRDKELRKKGKKRKSKKHREARRLRRIKEKQALKLGRGRKMKDPGPILAENAASQAGVKRPASKTPSPLPNKTPRLDDSYRNGIIGIAKSDSSNSTPLPIIATPPGLVPPRTPLSVESKAHTTSSESAHPSDPGHRAPSAAPLVPQGGLFVNTAQGLNPQLLAAAAANPFLAGAGGAVSIPFLQMLQQQHQQLFNGTTSGAQVPTTAAAAILSAAGAAGAAGALPNFGNNPLQSQLAAANAALLRGSLPTTARKPGRWCNMHVQIAQNVQNARVKEAAVRQQQQQQQEVKPDAALLAQQQALAAGQRQPPVPPHCMPSTSGAPPPGIPLAVQQQVLGLPPQFISALQQEVARSAAAGRASATPKPPTTGIQTGLPPQRPPSAMPARQGALPPGIAQLGLPPGLANLAASGLQLPPPSTTTGSLTNGQSDQAALLQLMLQQVQQQQMQQAQREQEQRQALQAQQQQQQQQTQAAQQPPQSMPSVTTAPASTATATTASLPPSVLAQQQQLLQQQQQVAQALRITDPVAASQLLQLQMLQHLDPARAALLAAGGQQPPVTSTATSAAAAQAGHLDLLRAHMEQQQMLQAGSQQEREALIRQMMAQHAGQQQNAGQQRGAQMDAALLAAQRLPAAMPGLPAASVPQTTGTVTSTAPASTTTPGSQLFQPGLMGLHLPTMHKQMPFANQLQQLQLKASEANAAIPNGR